MQIVEIKRDKKHTVTVTFGCGKHFNFDLDYWTSLCLHEYDFVDDEQLKNYLKESDYIRAKNRGMWFLDRADYSEKKLYEKIVAGGISHTAAARAIARFKELGMIDDVRYAARLAEIMSEANISKRESYAKLYAKGIPSNVIKSVLEETEFDETAQVEELLRKKYRTKLSNKDNIPKIYASLIRKGFSYSAVRDALKKYAQEIEIQEEY